MEIAEIKDRIAKKEAALEKAQRLADKYMAGFDEEDKDLIKGSVNSYRTYNSVVVPALDSKYGDNWGWGVKDRDAEAARSNLSKVDEYTLQLEKYKNALKAAEVKQDKLDAPRIKVIMDFLEDWKNKVEASVVENMKVMDEYYKVDHEETDHWNYHGWLTSKDNPDAISEEEWKAKDKELRAKAKSLKMQVSPLTSQVRSRVAEDHVDHVELRKILDKEAENMYLDMIERVTVITGEIEDVSNLHIGYKGDLNGIIIGTKGSAKVETIGAGGHNIQRYHFRTLIKPTNYRRPEVVGE